MKEVGSKASHIMNGNRYLRTPLIYSVVKINEINIALSMTV